MTQLVFERMGVRWETRGRDVFVPRGQSLTVVPDLGDAIPEDRDSPWPAFPADLTSIAIVVATQSAGTVLFHEKMFREPLVFCGQTHRHGCAHRVVRSAPLHRARPVVAARRAIGKPGHSRGHGAAHRRAGRARAERHSQRSARLIEAMSAWTKKSAHWAARSSGSRHNPPPFRLISLRRLRRWKKPLRQITQLTRPPMSKNRPRQILDLHLREVRRRPHPPRHLNLYPRRANKECRLIPPCGHWRVGCW